SGEQIGNYLLVQIVGMLLSNIIWGKLVKRFGFRGVVRGCILCGALLPVLVLTLSGMALPIFLSVFFLMGVAISARKIAFEGLLIEITTNTNRALHNGIVGTTSLTTALFPLIAGGLILWIGYVPVFLVVSILVASAWFTVPGIVPKSKV
ncbi:MAG: MFS transporter, partial [Desulfuromusa sp.]|nr:MFS transporter [Desulfuromusa sp.]